MQAFATAGISGISPVTVGGTGTTAKIFPSLLSSTAAASLVIPASGEYEGREIVIRAAGKLYVHGTTPTINFVLQSGTSLTAASNTTVATLAAAASLTTAHTYPFAFQAVLQGDSTSGIVQVVEADFACNGAVQTVEGTGITATSLTGINFLAGGPTGIVLAGNGNGGAAINLVFGLTWAVSDAANTASLDQFFAEA